MYWTADLYPISKSCDIGSVFTLLKHPSFTLTHWILVDVARIYVNRFCILHVVIELVHITLQYHVH